MTTGNGQSHEEDKTPPRLTAAEQAARLMAEKKSGDGGGLRALLWQGVVAIVVTFAMVQFFMNIPTRLDQMAATVQASEANSKAAVTAAVAPVTNQMTQVSNQISQVNSKVDSANSEITGIKQRESGFVSSKDISGLQTQVSQFSTTLNGHIADATKVQTQLDDLKKRLIDLQATINATNSLGTTGTGGTVVAGQVVPSVIGNPFTGVQYLKYDVTANNTTNSQTLSFQIANGTGKTINNLQLGILLQLYDVSGANLYTFPAGATLGVQAGSNMLGTIWTEQSTGVSYYRGFTNSALTGILGNIGALSQAPGVQTYSVTVSITNMTGASLPGIVIYPVVKVLSFN